MHLPGKVRRQARLDMQLDVSRIADYLSDLYDVLGDVHAELQAISEVAHYFKDEREVPPEIRQAPAYVPDMESPPPWEPLRHSELAAIARQSAAAGKARGF